MNKTGINCGPVDENDRRTLKTILESQLRPHRIRPEIKWDEGGDDTKIRLGVRCEEHQFSSFEQLLRKAVEDTPFERTVVVVQA